ncbi:MAG: hypothetical protein J3K34DRAFT_416867 [Monoraphidium minutum]|nr:MAG: hypothetical protein J3K34DRAFT_416867 [Monoraphidium minutum]
MLLHPSPGGFGCAARARPRACAALGGWRAFGGRFGGIGARTSAGEGVGAIEIRKCTQVGLTRGLKRAWRACPPGFLARQAGSSAARRGVLNRIRSRAAAIECGRGGAAAQLSGALSPRGGAGLKRGRGPKVWLGFQGWQASGWPAKWSAALRGRQGRGRSAGRIPTHSREKAKWRARGRFRAANVGCGRRSNQSEAAMINCASMARRGGGRGQAPGSHDRREGVSTPAS